MPRKDARKARNDQITAKENNGTKEKSEEESKRVTPKKKTIKTTNASVGIFRRCLNILKYVLLFMFIPPFLNYTALQMESKTFIDDGILYNIGFGQKLHLKCLGSGAPTVILDAPTGMSLDVWTLVQEEVAKITKVCSYDRAGIGLSERPPYKNESDTDNDSNRWMEFTLERMVDDLHKLVTFSSQQQRPLIFVGSEIGALISRFYTQMYESDVSDLVLIDPLVEELFTYDNSIWQPFWFQHLIPSFQTMQLSAAVGLTRALLMVGLMDEPIKGENIPQNVTLKQKYFMCNPRHLSSVVDEHHFINESFAQMRIINKIKPFPENVTVTVITGNYYDEQLPSALNKAWAKSQQHLISKLHPASKHIVVNDADHRMLYRKPEAVIEPIKRLVKQRRSKLPIRQTKDL